MTLSAETILVAIEDVFFWSRISQTAKNVGVQVEQVSPVKLAERAAQGPVAAVILDLNLKSPSSIELVRAMKSSPSARHIPLVGFVSHVETDLISEARSAGCDTVLSRSAFTERLPQLLQELAGKKHEP